MSKQKMIAALDKAIAQGAHVLVIQDPELTTAMPLTETGCVLLESLGVKAPGLRAKANGHFTAAVKVHCERFLAVCAELGIPTEYLTCA